MSDKHYDRTVRPFAGGDPKEYRSYHSLGATVYCYNYEESVFLWSVVLPNSDLAEKLMKDLYYGEYTGA